MSVADMQTQSWSVMQLNSEESNSNSFTLPSETEFDTTDANYVNIFNSNSFTEMNGKAYCKTVNGKRFILVNTKYFQIISLFNGYCSDTKRLISSVGRDRVGSIALKNLNNPDISRWPIHSTRKNSRYSANIELRLFGFLDLDTFISLIGLMLVLFPDLPYYFRRHTEDTPNVEALIYIDNMLSDDISVAFRGKINHVMCMFYSVGWDGINNHVNNVVSKYYLDQQPPPEDVKVNMPKTDFESMIGYRRPKKCDIGKTCPICYDEIKKTEQRVSQVDCCGNIFHTRCLRQWLTKSCVQPTCPTCRNHMCEN